MFGFEPYNLPGSDQDLNSEVDLSQFEEIGDIIGTPYEIPRVASRKIESPSHSVLANDNFSFGPRKLPLVNEHYEGPVVWPDEGNEPWQEMTGQQAFPPTWQLPREGSELDYQGNAWDEHDIHRENQIYDPREDFNEHLSLMNHAHDEDQRAWMDYAYDEDQRAWMDYAYDEDQRAWMDYAYDEDQRAWMDNAHDDDQRTWVDHAHDEDQQGFSDAEYRSWFDHVYADNYNQWLPIYDTKQQRPNASIDSESGDRSEESMGYPDERSPGWLPPPPITSGYSFIDTITRTYATTLQSFRQRMQSRRRRPRSNIRKNSSTRTEAAINMSGNKKPVEQVREFPAYDSKAPPIPLPDYEEDVEAGQDHVVLYVPKPDY